MSQKNTTSSPDKINELKEKARREANLSTPASGDTIQDVLYGARADNIKTPGGMYDN